MGNSAGKRRCFTIAWKALSRRFLFREPYPNGEINHCRQLFRMSEDKIVEGIKRLGKTFKINVRYLKSREIGILFMQLREYIGIFEL